MLLQVLPLLVSFLFLLLLRFGLLLRRCEEVLSLEVLDVADVGLLLELLQTLHDVRSGHVWIRSFIFRK